MSNDDTVPLFLVPFAQGVRPRRHRVVLSRAEMHMEELVGFLEGLSDQEEPVLGVEQLEFIRTKVTHIWMAVAELERYVARHPRTRIVARLATVKHKLLSIRRLICNDGA